MLLLLLLLLLASAVLLHDITKVPLKINEHRQTRGRLTVHRSNVASTLAHLPTNICTQ